MERVKNHGKNPVGRLGFLLLGIMFLNACSSNIYQVGYMASEQVPVKEGYFRGSDGDLELLYDFWGQRGVLFVKVINRSDKSLYVHWDRSSYIINGAAFPYMEMPPVMEASEDFILSGIPLDASLAKDSAREIRLSRTRSMSGSVPGSQVPPQAMIYSPEIPLDMPLLKLENRETRRFDLASSPLYVRNYLCYSDQPIAGDGELKCIDHGFYVHAVNNMPKSQGIAQQRADRLYTQKDNTGQGVAWSVGISILALVLGAGF